jgi:hypothetical protein
MAEVGSSRRCSCKPEVPVSSAAERKPMPSDLLRHDAAVRTSGNCRPPVQFATLQADAQKDSPLATNHSPLATAISNRELLELEHASTH